MRLTGFIGPSYKLQSVNADCQRTVNLYPEVNESGNGKEGDVACLRGTPGLRLLLTLPKYPSRGMHATSTGLFFVVAGDSFYQVEYDSALGTWSYTELGGLDTSTGPVSMADNGIHVVAVDGPNGYAWNMDGETYAQITEENFLGADQVTFQDGYLIFNKPDSQQFYITGLLNLEFDALDIGSAEGSPDHIVGLVSDSQNLFLFGKLSTEVFYNSGAADFPFARTQGALIEIGCSAAFTIQKLQGEIFWLGQDPSGRGIVYRAKGLSPQRISTHAIETVISGAGDLTEARAWTYQQSGHSFYCLNLPGATSTWCFDTTTGMWHERAILRFGRYTRHRAECHAFAYGFNVVGDFENGKLYALDPEIYSDDGGEISRERTSPHISQGLLRIFHSQFQLDLETGVGLATGQGQNPRAMLQWSDDNGHTWSNEYWTSIGAQGGYKTRAIWRRLGSARDRVYRVRITDPVKVTLLGAELGLTGGTT